MAVSNSVYSTPIKTVPGYLSMQVHPENEIFKIIEFANKAFSGVKYMIWETVNPSGAPPEPEFSNAEPKGKANFKANYDYKISTFYHNHFGQQLATILPSDATSQYYTALKYIEDDCLTKDFSKLTSKEILTIIKTINLCAIQTMYPGNTIYRTSGIFIFNSKVMPAERNKETFKLIDKFILAEATPKQKAMWKNTRAKIWEMAFAKNKKEEDTLLSIEEKDLVKNLVAFAPDHDKVPQLMREFAEELCNKIAAKEEIITLMAWTHQKLVDIHPFYDGNGRTARLFMNLLAMWAGKKPLLIPNASEYEEAVKSLDPAKFAEYLRKLETKQAQITPFFEQCLRARFVQYCAADNYPSLCKRLKEIKFADQ